MPGNVSSRLLEVLMLRHEPSSNLTETDREARTAPYPEALRSPTDLPS